jgi:oxygen-independent coproporphyrinogen-3 oxidase
MQPFSLYLHIPFCIHRCAYCDFNTYAGLEELIPLYVTALRQEIRSLGENAGGRLPVHSVFFGGGTPSLLPANDLESIFETLHGAFDLLPGVEITLEANPGTLSLDYLRRLRGLGVNRLSLGMQSAHPGELRLLERQHSYFDVIQAVKWARQAGFDNLNLDLIFGLPEQPMETWQTSLDLAIGLQPDHFSLYALSIETGTPFGHWARRGWLSSPDPDRAAEQYEWASERLEANNYTQYEISNWARQHTPLLSYLNPDLACRHNLQYWRNLPYLGLGAGAHGFAAGKRYSNVLAPTAYIQRLAQNQPTGQPAPFPLSAAAQDVLTIDQDMEIAETMMMGLRLTRQGVSAKAFQQRFAQSLAEQFSAPIQRFQMLGLLEWAGPGGNILRLTRKAYLLANQVFVEFI